MEELIQTLPTQTSCLKKDMYKYQGFWYDPPFIKAVVLAQQNFKAEPSDILVSSAPKTGTTWLKALTFALGTRKKKFDDSNNPLLTKVPHNHFPHLEFDLLKIQFIRETSDLPLISTHIPYSSLPESVMASDCKIVYIYRDVKDVVVSYYDFLRKHRKVAEEELSFEMVYEEFCQGFSWCGPYWDHVLGYLKASSERPGKILILKYQDLKSDAFGNVKRLAKFMGYPFSVQEEKEGVVEHIIKLCSFDNLRSLEANKNGTVFPDILGVENRLFFRKGEVGDWKNYFTDEMKEKIERLQEQKLGF